MEKKLVLGLGNLLLGDDGVGIHVIRELQKRPLPSNVQLADGGTSGFELLTYLESAQKTIIIDAMKAGCRPGTIYRLVPGNLRFQEEETYSLHQVGLKEILSWLEYTEKKTVVTIIGVEPKTICYSLKLSPELKRQLPRIVSLVLEELEKGDKT
ncbi:hydrogenase maturation protease [Calderihabitans maritimus]|uniref:Hydrogenase maturation protease n=1 Tax=Calderihabitans maritimus TaxID=1246530 RepID=A0A1Z5HNL6_9FIRM|nr:hydrogenase maturation protease [Calderihabitans maritimus]GAW91126.1 hydrogenase maturation protease [Calderihabitans maritimus]